MASRSIPLVLLVTVCLASACGLAQSDEPDRIAGEDVTLAVEELAAGLVHPWGLAFLPDGRMLVTERAGRLRLLEADGALSAPLGGVPEVFAQGQGGLLDVALDPDFAANRLVYLSYAAPGPQGQAATALGRGRLAPDADRLEGFEQLFRQEPWVTGPAHFGSRIVFAPDGTLFLTLGERYQFDTAQDLADHLGAIVRLNPNGSVPDDNPFAGQADAEPEIWSLGHRNVEAAAIHPETGVLWIGEMGPQGGDELNQPEAGRNYGWPVVSWGENYDGTDIPDPPTRPEFADAVRHWTPVISPSGMVFYTGDLFPAWQGDAFLGGLTPQQLVRVDFEGSEVVGEERFDLGARIREVVQGPNGALYVLTDQTNGKVWRLVPEE